MEIDVVAVLRAAGCVFAEEEAALLIEVAFDDDLLAALLARRVAGEPLEHIVGFVEFCGARYRVDPRVFIPRQRSRLLVEAAVAHGGECVLDLCCGSGALGLATVARLPGRARLIASDIDLVALTCAQANGVTEVYLSDLFTALPASLRGGVDLLLAHAPYVPTGAISTMPSEARDYEPVLALDGGLDGLAIQRRIIAEAASWLSPHGTLLTETSTLQAASLSSYAVEHGLTARVLTNTEVGATVVVMSPANSLPNPRRIPDVSR